MNYKGVIIEESLDDKSVLDKVKILSTKVSPVTERDQTPYLDKWTLHTVEVPEEKAEEIAEEISKALDSKHDDWYADYKNDKWHYIIYRNKVFKINMKEKDYTEAREYGLSLGIPEYQVNFN